MWISIFFFNFGDINFIVNNLIRLQYIPARFVGNIVKACQKHINVHLEGGRKYVCQIKRKNRTENSDTLLKGDIHLQKITGLRQRDVV